MITQPGNAVKKILAALLPLLIFDQSVFSQTAVPSSRSEGKMFVVVAVISAIFAGIVIFLVYLERRLTKLENQIKDHE
ncbi:MAG: hypothetical protein RI973_2415 [Bacteroidota bacterium]|jgi:CcmD family protein